MLYTDFAKCKLMENGPNADFDASFYEGLQTSYVRIAMYVLCLIRTNGILFQIFNGYGVHVSTNVPL